MQADDSRDLVRAALQLLALGAMIAATFWILRPFLIASVWAITLAVATWPILIRLQGALGGRRSLAVAVMTLVLLLVLVVPSYFGLQAILEHSDEIETWSQSLTKLSVPAPPTWIESLPLVGGKIAENWQRLAVVPREDLAAKLAPYAQSIALWFVGAVGSVGLLLGQFLLTVIVTAILYSNGETAADTAVRFARRLAGPQGENAVYLAADAMRGIALGVVVTAILQTAFSGIGIVVVGVPFAIVFTALIFILCIAQLGPALVLIPAIIWLYSTHGSLWGTAFLVWATFCMTFDNFVRPVLIRRGADLPLLLIFSGVIGGLVAFGIIGLFIGPVVLAVTYTLLLAWLSGEGETRNSTLVAGKKKAS